MGGLFVGILWGVLVSGIVLAAASLSSPLPPRPGAAAPVVAEAAAEGETEGAEAEVEAEVEPGPEAAEADGEAVADDAASGGEDTAATPAPAPAPTPESEPEPAPETDAAPAEEAEPEAAGPATEIPLPAGSEFNRPPTEEAAVLPAPDAAPNANAPSAPDLGAPAAAPLADTDPLPQPSVAAALPQVAAVAPDASAPTAPGADAAVPAQSAPVALATPDAAPTVEIRTITPPGAPVPQTAEADAVTEADDSPSAVADAAPQAEAGPITDPEAPTQAEDIVAVVEPRLPTIGGAATGNGLPQAGAAPDTPSFPSTTALPQVAVPGTDAAGEPVAEVTPANDGRAITAFAAPFDATDARPLLAIVLIDDPDSRLELSTLTRFTFPVTFVIDPLHPEAAERAATYRAAGFEVAILASVFPEGATPADVETAFAAAQSTLPEAVALVDTPDGRVQSDRPVLDATVAALAASGHGLLAFPQGLNAAEQSARREDVPGATLFRLLDDEDQRATEITRFLSRAAFTAAQEGVVVVAGRTRPDTVTALFSWALGERSSAVTLAPLSAALLRASEQ